MWRMVHKFVFLLLYRVSGTVEIPCLVVVRNDGLIVAYDRVIVTLDAVIVTRRVMTARTVNTL